jgi:hypothetical protein
VPARAYAIDIHAARGAPSTARPAAQSRLQWDNDRWRAGVADKLPRLAAVRVAEEAARADQGGGYQAGNRVFGAASAAADALHEARCFAAFDEQELQWRAEMAAERCRHLNAELAIQYAEAKGLTLPTGRKVTRPGLHRRTRSPDWWRRQLRKLYSRRAEHAFRLAGMVHKHASPMVTDDGLRRFKAQKAKNAAWLKSCDVVDQETGELFPLAEIAAKGISNPSIRRGELMVRIRGFEEIAAPRADVGLFATLTCPSAFHARHISGKPNERYNRATPREARDWLQKMWARARAKLARLSVLVYGFRVAEPHHDGTPHWHLLLFTAPAHAETVRAVLRGIWLAEYGDEPGAAEARTQVVNIDPAKGTAAGYCAKYVAKGIDGHGNIEADDETGLPAPVAAERIEAWSRIHGIRQFQQIGGPAVGLWRELRRVPDPIEAPAVEAMRAAVDKPASWSRFTQAAGGIEAGRDGAPCQIDKAEPMTVDGAGRKVLRLSEWGELPEPRAVGVRYIGECGRIRRIQTRREWRRVVRAEQCMSTSGDSPSPATSDNPPNRRSHGATAAPSRPSAKEISCGLSGGAGSMRPTSNTGACAVAWSTGPTSASVMFLFFRSGRLFSYLGPVGITIRGDFWDADPSEWTDFNEKSRAGPH